MKLPGDVLGYLDWSTGLLRINMEKDQYEGISGRPEHFRNQFEETLCHEMFHALQICACGFLFNHVTAFSKELWLKVFEMESDRSISRLLHEEVESSAELRRLSSDLCTPQHHGLSNLDIIESHAFLAHNRICQPDVPRDVYRLRMAQMKGSPYQMAFGYLEEKLGAWAGDYLCPIAYEALCFPNPVEIFVTIVEAVSQMLYAHVESAEDIEELVGDALKVLGGRDDFIGDPRRMIEEGSDLHPFYSNSLHQVNQLSEEGEIRDFMSFPESAPNVFLTAMLRPILLNDATLLTFSNSDHTPFDTEESHDSGLIMLAALSYKHLAASGSGLNFFALEDCGKDA